MKAVNLIPRDARRSRSGGAALPFGPGYAVLGVLAIVLALVTVYVLTNNSISDRKAELSSVKAQVAQAQARVNSLGDYQKFAKLAQARAQTVRQIVGTRFDWYGALSDLSKVVPAGTSLQSLSASVAPGTTSGSSGGSSSGNSAQLRGAISAPAFELTGCTKTQDDVARLMSRLRLINGVTRVTLGSSQKQGTAGTSGTPPTTTSSTGTAGCGASAPSFDLVVFFQPLPGAAATSSPSTAAPASTGPANSVGARAAGAHSAVSSTSSSTPGADSTGSAP